MPKCPSRTPRIAAALAAMLLFVTVGLADSSSSQKVSPSLPPRTMALRGVYLGAPEAIVRRQLGAPRQERSGRPTAKGSAHLTDQDMTGGHDVIRQVLDMYRRAFPDLQVKVEILVEAKDRVGWQRTLRATHQGDFKGFPATGRPIVWRDMATSRFRDGLIAEDWVITDLAERLLLARKR